MIKIKCKNYYGKKDVIKAERADYFIGVGCDGSSTEYYRSQIEIEKKNRGYYDKPGIVFVSINGSRKGRISVNAISHLLQIALEDGCSFIVDKKCDRLRDYNVGERELEEWFIKNNLVEIEDGLWQRKN